MSVATSHAVEGHVSPGFERVRDVFEENVARRGELGGACCAYHRGEKVVDLWGGIRNKQTGDAWDPDTMVIVYSATKGRSRNTSLNARAVRRSSPRTARRRGSCAPRP